MAARTSLNAANLEALGAARLAELLLEISDGNATAKRRLRLELAGADGPTVLVKEIRKRLATIARSRSFVEWQDVKALVNDLEAQRRGIVEQVAPRMPAEGLDLMWRFLDLANPVFARSGDGGNAMSGVFHTAVTDLGEIAKAARPDPKQLADQVFGAVTQNGYGQFDGMIRALQ